MAAGTLVDDDAGLALAHARAARDRASRIAVVREAVGVAAYHAGDYAEATRELRAYRRMSGDEGYRAVLADCERAQGRPEVALRLVREALADGPDRAETVELQLIEAGARQDLGETSAARLVLEGTLGGRPVPGGVDLTDEGTRRLASAYADLLAATDDPAAEVWQEAVTAASPDADEDVAFGEEELPAPETEAPETEAPETEAPETEAPETEAPETEAPETEAPQTAGDARASTGDAADLEGPDLDAPDSDAVAVNAVALDAVAMDAVTFDEDVEREVAELLGEVDPPADEQPGH